MHSRPIGAVTFDLWDCLFQDDSDEAQRSAAGRLAKPLERRRLVFEALNGEAPISQEAVNTAYDCCDAAFRKVWHEQFVTWTVPERLKVLLDGLNRTLPAPVFDELVRQHEEMELEFRPDPVPGAVEALQALHGKYPLAIVSDAIFSPGRVLRQLLQGADMLPLFDYFVFSDEFPRSKPHPEVFQAVARHFSIPVDQIVHIGDRPHNDIGGPLAVGGRGVLLTVAKTRPLEGHKPAAVCDDYAELPGILASLNGS